MFATVSDLHPSLAFSAKDGVYQSGALYGTHLKGFAPTLSQKIDWEPVTNTLACKISAKITAVKVLQYRPQLVISKLGPPKVLQFWVLSL